MNLVFIYGPPGVGKLSVASELARRLPRPGRAEAGKLASLETLRELLERHELFSPAPGRGGLAVDNTAPAPAEVAGLVASHYHLPAA